MSETTYDLHVALTYAHDEDSPPDPKMLCDIVAGALGPISPSSDDSVAIRAIHVWVMNVVRND